MQCRQKQSKTRLRKGLIARHNADEAKLTVQVREVRRLNFVCPLTIANLCFFSDTLFVNVFFFYLHFSLVCPHFYPCPSSRLALCKFISTRVYVHLNPRVSVPAAVSASVAIHAHTHRHTQEHLNFASTQSKKKDTDTDTDLSSCSLSVVFCLCRFFFFVVDCAGVGCGRLCYHVCVMCPFFLFPLAFPNAPSLFSLALFCLSSFLCQVIA